MNLKKLTIKQHTIAKMMKTKQEPWAMHEIKMMRRESARSLPIESSFTILKMFSTSTIQQERI
jgi:hypothetical protein